MKLVKLYILKHWGILLLPIVAMFITLGIDASFPYLQKVFVDDIILGDGGKLLTPFFGLFLTLVLTRCTFGYIKEYLFDKFSLTVSKEIRKDIFSKIQTFEFSFFDKNNTGELMSRIGEDVDIVWETISYGLRLLIEMIIVFIMASSIMFSLSKPLAIICLLILVPVAIMGWFFEKKFWDVYLKISDQTAEINSVTQQNISGIRLVKAFAREKHEIMKFLNTNQELYDLNLSQAKLVSQFVPIVECLTQLSNVAIIVVGGCFAIKGYVSIGILVAFSSYILDLSWCVRNISSFITMLSQNKASMDRIFKLLDRQPEITSPSDGYNPTVVKGDICFKDVCFSYNEEEVLSHINLFIPAGSSVAIMGATGCGKSTLLALIGRYYEVTSGKILIDGVNIKEWNLSTLRNHLSIVFQDTFLFSDTIQNNVDFGEEYTREEVIEATKFSCAYDFIEDLDLGLDTVIGERGVGLSGGQKQRLTIARALLQKSSILILDDATSALDMETEYTVLQNLTHTNGKATRFIIAHRISGVKDANIILYMKDGKIIEQGNHYSLLVKKGHYYDIYCDQFQEFATIKEVN
ncbi:MAG: ABC transporter ATP-binding protein [Cellulosilyticaceae bacterium]